MNIDWNEIIKAVLSIILPVLVGLAAAWVRKTLNIADKKAEAELGQQWWWAIKDAVTTAVKATEQSALAGLLNTEIRTKKDYAIEAAQRQLAQIGIVVDVRVIADLIESVVHDEFKKPVE